MGRKRIKKRISHRKHNLNWWEIKPDEGRIEILTRYYDMKHELRQLEARIRNKKDIPDHVALSVRMMRAGLKEMEAFIKEKRWDEPPSRISISLK